MSHPSSQDILNEQVIRVKRGRMNKFGFEPAWNSYFDFYLSAKYLAKPILQLEDMAFHLFLRKNLNDGDPNWVMPSYRQMMSRFGISQVKIQAMLARLEQAHLLQKVSGKRRGNNQSNVTNEYVLSDPIQELELFLTVAAACEFPAALKDDWKAMPTAPVLKINTAPVAKNGTAPVAKINTQQQTSLQQTSKEQQQQAQPPASASTEDVVVALVGKGISKKVAAELAAKYQPDLIRQKIELLDFLTETQSPLAAKNPAGYLRKAIQDDYQPPKGFKTRAEREGEQKRRTELERLEREAQEEKDRRRVAVREAWRAQVIADYQVSEQQLALWNHVLADVQEGTIIEGLKRWIGRSILIGHENQTVAIAIPYEYPSAKLQDAAAEDLAERLRQAWQQPVQVRFQIIRQEEFE